MRIRFKTVSQVDLVVEDVGFKDQRVLPGVKVDRVAVGVLQVSQKQCPGFAQRYRIDEDNRMSLTYRMQGRFSLSYISQPPLAQGKWYVALWLFQRKGDDKVAWDKKKPTTKRVKFYTRRRDVSFAAQAWPMGFLIIVTLGGGLLLLLYFHFFIQERFPLKCQELIIWVQLMFFYVWRGHKEFAQLTVFFAVVFGTACIQAAISMFQSGIRSGDRDICTFNERCHWVFFHYFDVSWNSLYSNLIYMVHGLLIILSFSLKEASCYSQKHFFYYDYSVSYAIGWSLTFVGLFSGFYHICPGRLVFQLDSTFMFTMSVFLCVAVVHGKSIRPEDLILESHGIDIENRRRNCIRAGEVFLFFLAPLVIFNYIGSLRDARPPRSGGYDAKSNAQEKENYGLSPVALGIYIAVFFLWLAFILFAGAFKTGIFAFRRKPSKGEEVEKAESKVEVKDETENRARSQTWNAAADKRPEEEKEADEGNLRQRIESMSREELPNLSWSQEEEELARQERRGPRAEEERELEGARWERTNVERRRGGSGEEERRRWGREDEERPSRRRRRRRSWAGTARSPDHEGNLSWNNERCASRVRTSQFRNLRRSLNRSTNKSLTKAGSGVSKDPSMSRMRAEASHQMLMAVEGQHAAGTRTLTRGCLNFLRVLYVVYCLGIIAYFILAFVRNSDMSVTFLNFCFSIGGMALMVGEVFHFRQFEVRRKDKTKGGIIAAVVIWYGMVVAFAVPALYLFSFQQVYLAGLDVADSRDINRECLVLNYYDSHSMWHILGSFMLLLTGLRVGMLSEPCRMCALKLIGETSATPSIAFEASMHGITHPPPPKEGVVTVEHEAAVKKRMSKLARQEVKILQRRDTAGAKNMLTLRDNKLPTDIVRKVYEHEEQANKNQRRSPRLQARQRATHAGTDESSQPRRRAVGARSTPDGPTDRSKSGGRLRAGRGNRDRGGDRASPEQGVDAGGGQWGREGLEGTSFV